MKKAPIFVIWFDMDKPRAAKRHVIRDLILVLRVRSTAVIGTVAYFSAKAEHDISQNYIDDAAVCAAGSFQSMAHAVSLGLRLVRGLDQSGQLSLVDPNGLSGLLFPIINGKGKASSWRDVNCVELHLTAFPRQ